MFGLACGFAMGPLFAAASMLRQARALHPRGDLYAARIAAEAQPSPYAELAARLQGHALVRFSGALFNRTLRRGRLHTERHALVRFSGALFKRTEIVDVLGCAIRFCSHEMCTSRWLPSDQDLLLATIHRPWTMPLAPLLTNAGDYLGNDYFAVSPFDVAGVGRLYFRLRPDRTPRAAGSRAQRLDAAVLREAARLHLEASSGPWGPWRSVIVVELTGRVDTDDAAVRFDPFADGRGIRPVGFTHSLRKGAYSMSQWARPPKQR
jgi:hypothetical protein